MAISVENLSVQLQSYNILSGISFRAAQSQTVGLLGPNGSGKSTLMKTLAGLIPAASASIFISGDPLSELPRRKLARRLAFVPQHADAEDELTVGDIVALGRTPHRRAFDFWTAEDSAAVNESIAFMKLENLLHRTWHRLSGGERQRCHIARTLAQKPDVLLLDEPVNHLDIEFQLELMRLITALPVTVVVALHDLNLAAKYCQQLVILKQGKVIATGSPDSILTPELIQNTWRVEARINQTAFGTLNIQYA